MAEQEAERGRWLRDIGNGLRLVAWAALIGGVGTNAISFVIPIVGGTRDSLWIARCWSLVFEMIALAGLVLVTRRPPLTGAIFSSATSALLVRVLGIAAVLNGVIVAILLSVSASREFTLVGVLSWRAIRPAAKVLLLWYVGTLLRRLGVTKLGRVVQWTAVALIAFWIIDYPVDAVVMALVNPEGALWWTYIIGAVVFGSALLVWTCVCLLKAAKRLPAEARGGSLNCG